MNKQFIVETDNTFTNNTGTMKTTTYDQIVVATGTAFLMEHTRTIKSRLDLDYQQKKQAVVDMYNKLYRQGYCRTEALATAQNLLTGYGTTKENPVVSFINSNKQCFSAVEVPGSTNQIDYLGYAVADTLKRIQSL